MDSDLNVLIAYMNNTNYIIMLLENLFTFFKIYDFVILLSNESIFSLEKSVK